MLFEKKWREKICTVVVVVDDDVREKRKSWRKSVMWGLSEASCCFAVRGLLNSHCFPRFALRFLRYSNVAVSFVSLDITVSPRSLFFSFLNSGFLDKGVYSSLKSITITIYGYDFQILYNCCLVSLFYIYFIFKLFIINFLHFNFYFFFLFYNYLKKFRKNMQYLSPISKE